MVRSRLPPATLLCLFGALLMLSPGLLMGGHSVYIYDVAITDPKEKEAIALAVEKYNQDRYDSANYFKMTGAVKYQIKEDYSLSWFLVETTCTKTAGKTMNYKEIQACKEIPGNEKILICSTPLPPNPVYEKDYVISKCGIAMP